MQARAGGILGRYGGIGHVYGPVAGVCVYGRTSMGGKGANISGGMIAGSVSDSRGWPGNLWRAITTKVIQGIRVKRGEEENVGFY